MTEHPYGVPWLVSPHWWSDAEGTPLPLERQCCINRVHADVAAVVL
jgi:hypothetical protein